MAIALTKNLAKLIKLYVKVLIVPEKFIFQNGLIVKILVIQYQ